MALRPSALHRVAGVVLLAAGGLLALPSPAHAVDEIAVCSFGSDNLLIDLYSTHQDLTISNLNGFVTVQDSTGSVSCATPTTQAGNIFIQQPNPNIAHTWLIDVSTPFASDVGGPLAGLLVPTNPGDPVIVATDSSTSQHWAYLGTMGGSNHQFTLDQDSTSDLSLRAGTGLLTLRTGSGDDTVDLWNNGETPYPEWQGTDIRTEDGNDTVHGGMSSDAISTGGSDDVAWGGPGSDTLYDAWGTDVYYGDLPGSASGEINSFFLTIDFSPDQVNPGATQGGDFLTYEGFGAPVSVSLDGLANDGHKDGFSSEGDNLNGLQSVTTGSGNDVIDAADFNFINTGAGDDMLLVHEEPMPQAQWSAGAGTDTVDLSLSANAGSDGQLNASGQGSFGIEVGPSQFMAVYVDGVEGAIGTPLVDTMQIDCACLARPGAGNDAVTLGDGATFRAESAADGADVVTILDDASVTLDYGLRTTALALTSDGEANDGAPGESDNVGTGATTLIGGSGNDTIVGSAADNTIRGGGGSNVLTGRGGNDRIEGGSLADTLTGGAGNDRLLGHGGADKLLGGDGDDVLLGDDASDPAGGKDTLDGGNGDDDAFGYAGNDTFLNGVSANGGDLLSGGAGVDTASYASRTAAVKVSLNGLFDDGAAGEGDKVNSDVENLTGGRGADSLVGNGLANLLTGGAGKDSLSGLAGNDTFQTLDGLVDLLNGGTGTDRAHRDTTDKVTSVEQRF